jgi:hypothetical protein
MSRHLAEPPHDVKRQTSLDLHLSIGLTDVGHADVAKSVDAADLKSAILWVCGFKSRRPHQTENRAPRRPQRRVGFAQHHRRQQVTTGLLPMDNLQGLVSIGG